jgi:hypothetical protein
MAKPAEETLVRRRRRAVLVAAVVLAIPVGFAVRASGDWTTFGAAVALLMILIAVGTQVALGPWTKEELFDGDPEDPSPRKRWPRGRDDEGEQLVLRPTPGRSGAHARR